MKQKKEKKSKEKKSKVLRVLGANYAFLSIPGNEDLDLHGESFGLTSVYERVIKVDSNAPLSQQKDTLLHELIHAADSETGQPKDRLEEPQVYRIARALFAIFHDNPGLAEWIASEDE